VSTTVSDNPAESRYEVHVDDKLAGFAQYHLYGRLIAFLHTEIDSDYEGQGLGSTLIRQSLDNVRDRGLTVQPFCPFVRAVIAKNPAYLDLVPQDDRERFDLAGA
jgi:predicted GNAT family acetyltransferase